MWVCGHTTIIRLWAIGGRELFFFSSWKCCFCSCWKSCDEVCRFATTTATPFWRHLILRFLKNDIVQSFLHPCLLSLFNSDNSYGREIGWPSFLAFSVCSQSFRRVVSELIYIRSVVIRQISRLIFLLLLFFKQTIYLYFLQSENRPRKYFE